MSDPSDSQWWLTEAFDQLPDAIMVIDTERKIRAINRKACDTMGISASEVVGTSCSDACLCARGKQHCFIRKAVESGGPVSGIEDKIIVTDRKHVSMAVNAVPLFDDHGSVIGGIEIMRDIAFIDEMESGLRKMAETDELTGLSRRGIFFEALRREVARHQRHGTGFALVMMDVDDFKRYNDTFGHPAGDELLRTVGRLLLDQARQEDTVARYGGEEFIALLVEVGVEEAVDFAERILRSMREETASVTPNGAPVTLSAGISLCGQVGGHEPNILVKAADDALYDAKRAGKNRAVVAGSGKGV